MTNVVWNAFIGQMMSRCILRSYADGDNGYRTEIKEGKASERQKVAARAVWLGRMLKQVSLNRKAELLWNVEACEKNSVAPFLLACLVRGCAAVSGTHTLCSFSPPFVWTSCNHLSRNTSCISVKYSLALLLIQMSVFSLSRDKRKQKSKEKALILLACPKPRNEVKHSQREDG